MDTTSFVVDGLRVLLSIPQTPAQNTTPAIVAEGLRALSLVLSSPESNRKAAPTSGGAGR